MGLERLIYTRRSNRAQLHSNGAPVVRPALRPSHGRERSNAAVGVLDGTPRRSSVVARGTLSECWCINIRGKRAAMCSQRGDIAGAVRVQERQCRDHAFSAIACQRSHRANGNRSRGWPIDCHRHALCGRVIYTGNTAIRDLVKTYQI